MATSQSIIDSVNSSELKNLRAGDDTVMLGFLNEGVEDIATELKLYKTSTTLVLNENLNNYDIPEQMVILEKVVDSDGRIRPINKKNDELAIFKISPFVLQLPLPEAGKTITVTYYFTPGDYSLTDNVELTVGLIKLLKMYIAYKGTISISAASTAKDSDNTYYMRYKATLAEYKDGNTNTYDEEAEIEENLNRKGFV